MREDNLSSEKTVFRYDESDNRITSLEQYKTEHYGRFLTEEQLEKLWHNLPVITFGYDSEPDTLKHIKRVSELLGEAAIELIKRGAVHDNSKLSSPEKECFDIETPLLKGLTYNTPEYHESLKRLGVALDHHYKENSHHPQHYENGINGFDLFDLIEMFFDWKAATERHGDGCIYKSIKANKTRYNMSDQLCDIFINTAKNLKY